MSSINRRNALGAGAALLAPPWSAQAQSPAQPWPTTKPVKIVVAFAPGGSLDALARRIGKHVEASFGGSVVVENLSGAGGRIGTQAVARAPGDGYTLITTSSAAHGVAPGLYPKAELGYEPMGQFTHIGLITSGPMALIVKADAPYKNLGQLVEYVKAKDQPMFYGSGGIGSLGHLTGALVGQKLAMPVQHVSYRGSAPALQDLLAGNVMAVCDNLSSHMAQFRAGNIRLLGVASATRFPTLPEVPTFIEQGYPDVVANAWYGLSGSGGIPPEIAGRLNTALGELMRQDEMRRFVLDMAMKPEGQMSVAEYTRFVGSEIGKWSQVIKAANITVS